MAPASKLERGGKGEARNIFREAKVKKMHAMHVKICHFYAEVVKFGLIFITHLKLFWAANCGDGQKIFLGPCGTTTAFTEICEHSKNHIITILHIYYYCEV